LRCNWSLRSATGICFKIAMISGSADGAEGCFLMLVVIVQLTDL
jgi:hypothetical protein